MNEYPQIFYIDPPDDLETVKEKILSSKKKKIILVLPEENKNLKSIEKMTVLQREAQLADKELSIYSTDSTYKKLAEDCGIQVEESLIGGSFLNKKGEVSFRPPVSDILPRKEILGKKTEKKEAPDKILEKEKVVQKKESLPKEVKPQEKKRDLTFAYVLVLLILIGGAIFAYFWLPKADIYLVPESNSIDFSGAFWVKKDANFDLENSIIPGQLIEKEKTIEKNFTPSEEKDVSVKAKGEIIVYNESNSSYRFVPGTRFQSQDGKIFRALDWVSIPAGAQNNPGTVKIEVEAEEPGEAYNIKPTNFTLPALQGSPLYNLIYGKSTKEMTGGFIGKAKVVSQYDIQEAEREMKALQEKAVDDLSAEILKDLPENLQFLKEAVVEEKEDIVFDKKAGEAAEVFKGRTKVKIKLLVFKEEEVRKIISNIVKNEVKDGIDFQEILSSQTINYQILDAKGWDNEIYIEFKGSEKVAFKIDEEEVKQKLMGKNYAEFQKFINEDMKGKIKNSNLVLQPFWVNRIPTRENRVNVKVEYK
jgi:hypothetical protein